MTEEPIEDSETVSDTPASFEPNDGETTVRPTATIVHRNGSTTVTDFVKIEEYDAITGAVQVWYDMGESDWDVFYDATIVEVSL